MTTISIMLDKQPVLGTIFLVAVAILAFAFVFNIYRAIKMAKIPLTPEQRVEDYAKAKRSSKFYIWLGIFGLLAFVLNGRVLYLVTSVGFILFGYLNMLSLKRHEQSNL